MRVPFFGVLLPMASWFLLLVLVTGLRYFTSQELRDLFVLDDPGESSTQRQLQSLHAPQRQDAELDTHLAFISSLHAFGISHHDLLFSTDQTNEHCDDEQHRLIEQKVRSARDLLHAEAGTSDHADTVPVPREPRKKPSDLELEMRKLSITDAKREELSDGVTGDKANNPIDLTLMHSRPSAFSAVAMSPFFTPKNATARYSTASFTQPGRPLMNSTALMTPGVQRDLDFSFDVLPVDDKDQAPPKTSIEPDVFGDEIEGDEIFSQNGKYDEDESAAVGDARTTPGLVPEIIALEVKRDCRSERKRDLVGDWLKSEEFTFARHNDTFDTCNSDNEYRYGVNQSTSPMAFSDAESPLPVPRLLSARRACAEPHLNAVPVSPSPDQPPFRGSHEEDDSSLTRLSRELFLGAIRGNPDDSCGKRAMLAKGPSPSSSSIPLGGDTIAISDATSSGNVVADEKKAWLIPDEARYLPSSDQEEASTVEAPLLPDQDRDRSKESSPRDCLLSPRSGATAKRHAALTAAGDAAMQNGNGQYAALQVYLSALELNDEDWALHDKALPLAAELLFIDS